MLKQKFVSLAKHDDPTDKGLQSHFDAYMPNSKFSKRNAIKPDFYIHVASYIIYHASVTDFRPETCNILSAASFTSPDIKVAVVRGGIISYLQLNHFDSAHVKSLK